jgi:hypothetical protein
MAINIVPIRGLEEISAPLLLVIVVSVNLVDWDNSSGLADLIADELTVVTDKFLPAVCAPVTGINCSGTVVNEEDPEMAAAAFAGCSESSVVLGEIDDVVNPDFINSDRAHNAPPSTIIVATRALKATVEPS